MTHALVWCLGAIALISIVASVALIARTRALTDKRRQDAEEQQQRLDQATAQIAAHQSELKRSRAERDGVIAEARAAAEDSTKSVLKGAASFLQSLAAEQTALLDSVQRKYGGHEVLNDLLDVHHANAQMARKAQGIAVMCGAPLGRRNRPASVYDVARSAQGQIRNFQRVSIMQQPGLALKATAVAPVALAVAELLDNAASFSQHDAPIEVTFQRVQGNLCIVIDDAGVSMSDEDRQRATTLLSGDEPPQLQQLGTQPKFGFPVIGLIARQYGFKVDVSGVSRYGGVRAVVLLPEELWTMEEATPKAAPTPTPTSAPAPAAHVAPSPVRQGPSRSEVAPQRTPNGLPKRANRQSPNTPAAPADMPHPDGVTQSLPRASSRGLGAFQRGTLEARADEAPLGEGSDDR
ncbi:ATP-binding protein [Streptomyces sp. NPDC002790]|uniref:ATP-binding protein n=1 Tax=Streptomyces sp. NPDC002790 TaxID=3154431 RepID=UPI00332E341D